MYSFTKSLGDQFLVKFNFTVFSIRILIYYILLMILLIVNFPYKYFFLFNYIFYVDIFSIFIVLLILLKLIFFLLLIENVYSSFNKSLDLKYISLNFELIFIFIFAIIGMIGIIFSNDFIILYLFIELQSLSLYLLAASTKNLQSSVESSIKYFILGSFASSLFLFGFSILYGFLGISSFDSLVSYSVSHFNIINSNFSFFIIGFLLIFFGLLFKLGIFPFHQWLPDIYVGCDFLIVIFFAMISKLSIIFVFIKFLLIIFLDIFNILNYLLVFCSFFSILIGSFGALFQYNIRKLLAYSSITNMGYILLFLFINSIFSSTFGLLFYLNYVFCIVFILSIFYLFRSPKVFGTNDSLNIFISYIQKDYTVSFFLVVFLFSLFGLPPFLGFFTKFYLLLILFSQKYYLFLFAIFIVSVLSVFYYFRLMNFYFFNLNKFSKIGYVEFSELISYFFVLMFGFIISFILFPNFYLNNLFYWGLDVYI